jgi:hypothetical protein
MPETEQRNINPAALPDIHRSPGDIVLSVILCPRLFTGISANGRLLLVEI